MPSPARIAARLFGREGAVIDIDLAPMTEDSAISTLLGSAPGLVGSDRTLPLHALRRSPWQVVLFRGIDACAMPIRDTVASALAAGRFTDAMGRSIPLGAAIVVMTAPGLDAALPEAVRDAALGAQLIAACDVVAGGTGPAADGREAWVRAQLVDPLVARLGRSGYPATATDGARRAGSRARCPPTARRPSAGWIGRSPRRCWRRCRPRLARWCWTRVPTGRVLRAGEAG